MFCFLLMIPTGWRVENQDEYRIRGENWDHHDLHWWWDISTVWLSTQSQGLFKDRRNGRIIEICVHVLFNRCRCVEIPKCFPVYYLKKYKNVENFQTFSEVICKCPKMVKSICKSFCHVKVNSESLNHQNYKLWLRFILLMLWLFLIICI